MKKLIRTTPPECYFEEVKGVDGCPGYAATMLGEEPCSECKWRKEHERSDSKSRCRQAEGEYQQ